MLVVRKLHTHSMVLPRLILELMEYSRGLPCSSWRFLLTFSFATEEEQKAAPALVGG
jgi:hypothetical protein